MAPNPRDDRTPRTGRSPHPDCALLVRPKSAALGFGNSRVSIAYVGGGTHVFRWGPAIETQLAKYRQNRDQRYSRDRAATRRRRGYLLSRHRKEARQQLGATNNEGRNEDCKVCIPDQNAAPLAPSIRFRAVVGFHLFSVRHGPEVVLAIGRFSIQCSGAQSP